MQRGGCVPGGGGVVEVVVMEGGAGVGEMVIGCRLGIVMLIDCGVDVVVGGGGCDVASVRVGKDEGVGEGV